MKPHPFIAEVPVELVDEVRAGLLALLPGEVRVVRGLLRGCSAKEVAAELGITVRTADTQVSRVTSKCGCSKPELVRICCFDLVDDLELFETLARIEAGYVFRSRASRSSGA